MKKSFKSLTASIVLAAAILACTTVLPKTDTPQDNAPTATEVTNTAEVTNTIEVTNTAEVTNTPESEKPFELIGVWKCDDLRAYDNSWSISYPIYFEFTNEKQYVYHGADKFANQQATDVADIVYLNIDDATLIKKFTDIPDQPEFLGKFQKWTWRFDNENVLFTVYGIMDSQELALSDSIVAALGTGVKIPTSQTDAPVTTPPAQEPVTLIKLSPGKFGYAIWIDVIEGDYKLTSGATMRAGSSIGVEESWMTFPIGLSIDIEGGNVTLQGTTYPPGTKLYVDDTGSLIQR